ncbi:MAG: GldG family protein [Herbinix sp.]|nr:GldG family protein [Herbinix sp.]
MKDIKENEKKTNFFGNMKASFSGRKFRNGAYVTMVSVVVIVIILVANMIVSKMNIQFDFSKQGMYTLTKDTKEMAKGLTDDITIYYLVQPNNETDLFKNIVKQYDIASDKITVVNKNPVLYPQFASQYVDASVTENSFLVVNNTNKRSKYVDYSDMLIQEMNYQTYQQETTGIDVEGQLTAAIQYVTSTDLPKMYVVSGHGETATGVSFSTAMGKMNVNVDTLATVSEGSIPDDCDMLYINAPQSDFSEAETKMIKDYLIAGGKAIITLNYNATSLTNFLSILKYYGIEVVNGVVIEGDSSKHLSNYVNYLIPNIETHDITSGASDNSTPVFMPDASGLKILDTKRSTLTIEPLLATSDAAFSKVNTSSTSAAKEDGDIAGPFNLGLEATDTYNNITSSIVVYSSAYTFGEETATYSNSDLLTGTVGFLAGDKDLLSIPTKSLADATITVSQQQAIMLGALVVFVIPALILFIGIMVTLKRRKK